MEETKFTIEEQVMLGDYIHDCDSAIIMVLKNKKDEDGDLLITTRTNDTNTLVCMIVEAMEKNPNLGIVFRTAVAHYELNLLYESMK